MENKKFLVNCKNQYIRFYGYNHNSKCYYAMVDYEIVTAKKIKELCAKIYISHTALHRGVQRNDIA